MMIDDEMWSRLGKLLPKPKGRHGNDNRLFIGQYVGCLKRVPLGVIYQQIMVTGKVLITAITIGRKRFKTSNSQ